MTAPVVILPPSSAVGIEARSKVERQALFHIAGTGLWARNGTTVRLAPVLGSLILALAAARGRTLAYGAAVDAVWGDDPDGGPLDVMGLFNVHRSKARDDLASLGLSVDVWWGCGYTLKIKRLRFAEPPRAPIALPRDAEPYWAPRARMLAERGAKNTDIAVIIGRNERVIRTVLRAGPRKGRPRNTPNSFETKQRSRLRAAARTQAAETGEPVERIYARWGCETVDRSRLWDQRRAASQLSEARP